MDKSASFRTSRGTAEHPQRKDKNTIRAQKQIFSKGEFFIGLSTPSLLLGFGRASHLSTLSDRRMRRESMAASVIRISCVLRRGVPFFHLVLPVPCARVTLLSPRVGRPPPSLWRTRPLKPARAPFSSSKLRPSFSRWPELPPTLPTWMSGSRCRRHYPPFLRHSSFPTARMPGLRRQGLFLYPSTRTFRSCRAFDSSWMLRPGRCHSSRTPRFRRPYPFFHGAGPLGPRWQFRLSYAWLTRASSPELPLRKGHLVPRLTHLPTAKGAHPGATRMGRQK